MSALRANNERHLGFLLSDISRLARREFDRRVRHLGLTRAQWLFLFHLNRQPGATQSELAEQLQMEKISVSRQAERLERAGWIERRDSREDGRAYHLYLTPRAGRIVEKLDHMATELRDDYLRGLPHARRSALFADLSLIKANLLELDHASAR
ncbi:MAG: MarR family transcriptional regulator [Opitutus sp.]